MQEAAAGRIYADVMTMSDMSAANAMTRRGLFVPFKPVAFDKVLAEAKDPNGHYVAQRPTLVGMVARTDRVASADLPKTWTDLMHPKYKGRMVMADPSFASLQLMLVATLSQKLGWQFYEGLRRNDTLVVQGNEQVYDMIKRGERVIAAEASDPRIYHGRRDAAQHDRNLSGDGLDPGPNSDRSHQGLAPPQRRQAVCPVQPHARGAAEVHAGRPPLAADGHRSAYGAAAAGHAVVLSDRLRLGRDQYAAGQGQVRGDFRVTSPPLGEEGAHRGKATFADE